MLRSIYRTLFLAFLIVLPSLKSAAEINGIILHQYGGASTLMPFDDIKEITFTSDQLKIGNKYYDIQRPECLFSRNGSTIDFSVLSQGIYIVSYGQKAIKIIKK